MTRWRFSYLYDKSIKQNKTQEFPSIIILADARTPPFDCATFYHATLNYLKKHKPNRVLFSYRWLMYWKNYVNDGSVNIRDSPCEYGIVDFQIRNKRL